MNAMDVIPYEENSFYIFDRGYNDFERLFRINAIGAYFIVRGKKNNDFKPMKWTRRYPPDIHRNNRLLYDGNRAEKDGNQQAYL